MDVWLDRWTVHRLAACLLASQSASRSVTICVLPVPLQTTLVLPVPLQTTLVLPVPLQTTLVLPAVYKPFFPTPIYYFCTCAPCLAVNLPGREADRLYLVTTLRMSGAIPLFLPFACM